MLTLHNDEYSIKTTENIKFLLKTSDLEFILTNLIQKVRILTVLAKADQSGITS